MRAYRRAAIALAALTVLLLGGAVYLAGRFDAAGMQRELARAVQEKYQRQLRIDGAVQFTLWPELGVTLHQLSLSEPGSERTFATVERAHVAVALRPLLARQLVVNALAIDGARLTLIRYPDGRLNIADLLATDPSASPPLPLDIAAIRIGNAQLDWHDEQSGRRVTLSGLDLASGRVQADAARQNVQIAALTLAAQVANDAGRATLHLASPRLTLAAGQLAADTLSLDAALAGAGRRLDLKLDLSGIAASAQALQIAKLGLAFDAGSGAAQLKGTLHTPLRVDLGTQRVVLEQLAGTLDLTHPRLPLRTLRLPLGGTLQADLAQRTASGKLATQFDESRLALQFALASFAPLRLNFALDIDRLNLDKYLPPSPAGGARGFDFTVVNGMDLGGTARIGSLQVANVKASRITMRIKTRNGRLEMAASPHPS